ncbi:MAG: N-acetylmuramoyl-L-alanine amidase [Bryobacterales bacterium]|nr:N-acetylmuramoyl-L-alanine amidase [Bryobacterales bacterium]
MVFLADAIRSNFPWRSSRLAITFCLLLATIGARAASLKEIRFWSLGDVTRVVVQLDGEFRYKWARLENPPRVFFDLPDTKLAIDRVKEPSRVRVIPVNDRALKQIRFAENSPRISRVVLDLAGDYEFEASQLANPPRLIIEIRTSAKPATPIEVSRGIDNNSGTEKAPARTPETATAHVQPTSAAATPPVAHAPTPQPAPAVSPAVETAKTTPKAVTPPAAPPAPAKPEPVETARTTPPPAAVKPPDPKPAVEDLASTPIAKPAARTASGQQSLTRALGLKIGKVVIDPGHGGKDQGTTGANGLLEKDLMLDIAKRVKKLVEENLGNEVLLTREDDVFIALEERTAFANRHRADLFVSLHANSSPFRLASGPETFYLDFTTSRESMDLAARENATAAKSVADLQDIVKKIALKDKRDESRDFAAKMQKALFKAQRAEGSPKKNRGVKSAPFVVLIGAEMPSILVEIGFLSNKAEVALLQTSEYRQTVAQAVFEGLHSYLASLSHFEPNERAARE